METYFVLIRYIFPVHGAGLILGWRLGVWGLWCEVEDVSDFFLFCHRIADLWKGLYSTLLGLILGVPPWLGGSHVGLPFFGPPGRAAVGGPLGRLCAELWAARHNLRLRELALLHSQSLDMGLCLF